MNRLATLPAFLVRLWPVWVLLGLLLLGLWVANCFEEDDIAALIRREDDDVPTWDYR